jgi:hypothetical protein
MNGEKWIVSLLKNQDGHRGPQRRKAPWLSTAFLMYSYRSKAGREGFVFPLWLSVGKFKMTLLKNE